jgi:hypothetical protein
MANIDPSLPSPEVVLEMYRSGMSVPKIAEHFKCSTTAIWSRVHKDPEIQVMPGVRKYDDNEMIRLREEGKSMQEIALIIGCSVGSVWRYTHHLPMPQAVKDRLYSILNKKLEAGRISHTKKSRERREAIFNKYENLEPSKEDLYMAGLYAGEGAKVSGRFTISNSNPDIIRFVIKYLLLVGIKQEEILVTVCLHEGRDWDNVQEFWYNTTNVPKERIRLFRKPPSRRTHKPGGKKHTLPFGTVSISVRGKNSIPLYERMRGISSPFCKIETVVFKGEQHVYWKNYNP